MSKREQNKANTLKRIYETAMELFAENGFEETSMSDIAKESGVARSTLFNYVSGKADFIAMFAQKQREHIEEYKQSLPEHLSAYEKVRKVFFEDLNETLSSESYAEIALSASQRSDPMAQSESENRLKAAEVYESIFAEGIATGELDSDLDALMASHLVSATYFHVLNNSLITKKITDPVAFAEKALDLIWAGLGRNTKP